MHVYVWSMHCCLYCCMDATPATSLTTSHQHCGVILLTVVVHCSCPAMLSTKWRYVLARVEPGGLFWLLINRMINDGSKSEWEHAQHWFGSSVGMCFNSAFTGLSGIMCIHLRIKFGIELRAGGEEWVGWMVWKLRATFHFTSLFTFHFTSLFTFAFPHWIFTWRSLWTADGKHPGVISL